MRMVVTGGSSGIGLALVTSLVKRPGCKVFATGQRQLQDTALAAWLRDSCTDEERGRLCYSAGDTSDEATVTRQLKEAVDFFDGDAPRGFFLNAGIGGGRYPLEEFDVERFDAIMRTNVRGPFLWMRAALPLLKATPEPSQIVVVSSVMGYRGSAQAAPYCASKFAVNGLVLSLRAELKAARCAQVKCGLVAPAAVDTPWWQDAQRGSCSMSKQCAHHGACFCAGEQAKPAQDASANTESILLEATG